MKAHKNEVRNSRIRSAEDKAGFTEDKAGVMEDKAGLAEVEVDVEDAEYGAEMDGTCVPLVFVFAKCI